MALTTPKDHTMVKSKEFGAALSEVVKKTRKKLLNSLALRLSKSTQLTLLAAEHIPESEFNCLLST